jgi:hypothetical protein
MGIKVHRRVVLMTYLVSVQYFMFCSVPLASFPLLVFFFFFFCIIAITNVVLCCYPSPVHLMQIYGTVACMWYKMSSIWWIVAERNGLQTSIYTICHHTCPVTMYVYNRCSYDIMLCTTVNQIIGILYHTHACVQYICIRWTGLGQQHIATCLPLQLCKKIWIRKEANGMLQNIKCCIKCH